MLRVIAISALLVASLSAPASAQEMASESLRATISKKLQSLVDAANAGDPEAFFALTSGSPHLVIVGAAASPAARRHPREPRKPLRRARSYKWSSAPPR